jgi:GntR family transcriptional regulator
MAEQILSQIRVDKDAPIPIYQQLQNQLERLIADGTWRLKDPLPSETVLAQRLQISVMTVRQAMAQLVNKGLIYREKGRGTFVVPQPLEHHLHRLESFTEDMQARALVSSSKTLVFEVIPAPDAVAVRLNLSPCEPVLYLKRLRLVGKHPVALHDAYVNRTDLQRHELDAVGSLYALLEQKGIELFEADETLEAVVADDDLARLLKVPPAAPILKATRLTWDRQHTPVELVIASYRGDFYRYAVRLHR